MKLSPALQRREAKLVVFLGRQIDDDQAVDAGRLRIGEETCRRRRCRSDCSSPSARSACRRRPCGIRAPARSVFFSVCPALSARRPAAWIAGPSAIGSVNGMPSLDHVGAGFRQRLRRSRARSRNPDRPPSGRSRGRRGLRAAARRSGGRCGCSFRSLLPRYSRDAVEILVAAAGEIDHHQVILRLRRRECRSPARAHAPVSSAGMMPSSLRAELERRRRASSSVADRNFTRPISCSQACSGPMPG